jgi:pimeloyl-ACP methyl ester carboxylesterase
MFRDPDGFADAVVAADDMAFLDRLWREWSPGYDAAQELANVKECLREPERLAAAIEYYRSTSDGSGNPSEHSGSIQELIRSEAHVGQAPQPTLYMHGADDGCISVDLARHAESLLAPGSRMVVIEEAGHFLQLEKPGEVNGLILAWTSTENPS